MLVSEEEVRNRLITPWLRDHGFVESDFDIEFGYEYQLGTERARRPRCDAVVRNVTGRNLLVIEVKAPGEPLGESAFRQAMSYARTIVRGGFPPFVLVSNGGQTEVYDTVAELPLAGGRVPEGHPFIRHPVTLGADDIGLRRDALRLLVSPTPENLLAFCRSQVERRMHPLLGDDPASGKKYIPALYVEREVGKDLHRLVDEERRAVTLVVGPPQVGKTNLMCAAVARRLEAGHPTLFFPAIGLDQGLLHALRSDFCSFFNDASDVHHALGRLGAVAQRGGERLLVFVDGWNEVQQELARSIGAESHPVHDAGIGLVLSLTELASSRLLLDGSGNPSPVAEAIGIDVPGVGRLQAAESFPRHWPVVRVPPFAPDEVTAAYQRYASYYSVSVPSEHRRTRDPLLLRLGMDMFRGGTLPARFDEPGLLAHAIREKARRRSAISEHVVDLLTEAGACIVRDGAPIPRRTLNEAWGAPLDSPLAGELAEVALLALMEDARGRLVADFYYSRERDFVISHWVHGWPAGLRADAPHLVAEWARVAVHAPGRDALRWFLSTEAGSHMIGSLAPDLRGVEPPELRRAIFDGAEPRAESFRADWLDGFVAAGLADSDAAVRLAACRLALARKESGHQREALESTAGDSNVIAQLLRTGGEYELYEEDAHSLVLDVIRELHGWDIDGDSAMTSTLLGLVDHPERVIRIGAAQALGYAAAYTYLRFASERIAALRGTGQRFDPGDEYAQGLPAVIAQVGEMLYGSMCHGMLHHLKDEPEMRRMEYDLLAEIATPVIDRYSPSVEATALAGYLEELKPPSGAPGEAPVYLDPDQLALPLAEERAEPEAGGLEGQSVT